MGVRVAILVGEVFLEHAPLGRRLVPIRESHRVRDDRDARLLLSRVLLDPRLPSKLELLHLRRQHYGGWRDTSEPSDGDRVQPVQDPPQQARPEQEPQAAIVTTSAAPSQDPLGKPFSSSASATSAAAVCAAATAATADVWRRCRGVCWERRTEDVVAVIVVVSCCALQHGGGVYMTESCTKYDPVGRPPTGAGGFFACQSLFTRMYAHVLVYFIYLLHQLLTLPLLLLYHCVVCVDLLLSLCSESPDDRQCRGFSET